MSFHLKMALDFPKAVVIKKEPTPRVLSEEEKIEIKRTNAFRGAFGGASFGMDGRVEGDGKSRYWKKSKRDYISPYLTCSECNHIAFVDSLKLRRRLDLVLEGKDLGFGQMVSCCEMSS